MKIGGIVPYERNARHNEKAIPVVAESIREFGLRGTIGLESRENPVIVFGHTRVAACKSLGWDEIPDEKIEYCDDLTEEQIKAFRLADNRTSEVATWNKALLKSEIASLGGKLDMSRFEFDFKSKALPYGAERLKTDRAYNLDKVSRESCNRHGFPALKGRMAKPDGMVGFNYAKSAKVRARDGKVADGRARGVEQNQQGRERPEGCIRADERGGSDTRLHERRLSEGSSISNRSRSRRWRRGRSGAGNRAIHFKKRRFIRENISRYRVGKRARILRW